MTTGADNLTAPFRPFSFPPPSSASGDPGRKGMDDLVAAMEGLSGDADEVG